jgi:hypothetical protein
MRSARPLPGIRFEALSAPVRGDLPRMDIPVFVGFSAAGPVDVPVPIEDPGQFTAVFGADVALPAPARRRSAECAQLGPVARAFFRNGGRRCWIVRVARRAESGQFTVPGLIRVETGLGGGALAAPAVMRARSEGSWSDGLAVRTNLVGTRLALQDVDLSGGSTVRLHVQAISARHVRVGDVVRITWLGGAASLHVFVTLREEAAGSPLGASVVALGGRGLWIAGGAIVPAPDPSLLPPSRVAERLTFDLTVERGAEGPVRLRDLGFTPEDPRYVGALPDDVTLYGEATRAQDGGGFAWRPARRAEFAPNLLGLDRAPEEGWPELWRAAAEPRFPLACPLDGAVYLPAAMDVVPSEAAGAEHGPATTLERDGLAVFDAGLFLDPELGDASLRDLLDRADAIRYRDPVPRSLTGIHAALAVDEATMIAAPDALQRGWHRIGETAIASPLASSPLAHPELWRGLDCAEPLPKALPPAASGFIDRAAADPIAAPVLQATAVQGRSFELSWLPVQEGLYELEEALFEDFSDASVILRGPVGARAVYDQAAGDYYYRVRRVVGARTSDWSNGIGVRVAAGEGWESEDPAAYDDATLVSVQRALVRLSAARADLVALLALPAHYDESQAVAHVSRLTGALEVESLSYAALWHPWLLGRETPGEEPRAVTPEGATAGVMAARAIARGAWIAPANEPLRGPVALTPVLPDSALQALQDAGVNVVRQQPAAILCLDADTLSGDDTVRPLNVRRLLILLRRAAVQSANRFAFEPNGESLQRALKRGFDGLLEGLFQRGAFGGRRAREAFQVVTDESLNTSQSVEAGRLLAEIRVAPSRPLSFLTIRVLKNGETTLAEEAR